MRARMGRPLLRGAEGDKATQWPRVRLLVCFACARNDGGGVTSHLRLLFRCVIFFLELVKINRWFWIAHAEPFQIISGDLRDNEIPIPFVVGWNDMPRRMVR